MSHIRLVRLQGAASRAFLGKRRTHHIWAVVESEEGIYTVSWEHTWYYFFSLQTLSMLNSLTDLAFGKLREWREDGIEKVPLESSCKKKTNNNNVKAEEVFCCTNKSMVTCLVRHVVSINANRIRKSSSFSSNYSPLSIPPFI